MRFVVRTEVPIKNLRKEVLTTKELPIFKKDSRYCCPPQFTILNRTFFPDEVKHNA
jgi:hypothetical protein